MNRKYSDIQIQIIRNLLLSDQLRYSQIRPKECENDLFNYHLQSLVKRGLIIKDDGVYWLSDEGIIFAVKDKNINARGNQNELHKMNCLNLVVKYDDKGEIFILNHKRKRFPFMNKWGISGGPINSGESALDASKRTLKLKFGLDGEFSRVIQITRVIFKLGERTFQDITFWVCLCEQFTGDLITQYKAGENKWMLLKEVRKLEQESPICINGLIDLFNLIENNNTLPNETRYTPDEVVQLTTLR